MSRQCCTGKRHVQPVAAPNDISSASSGYGNSAVAAAKGAAIGRRHSGQRAPRLRLFFSGKRGKADTILQAARTSVAAAVAFPGFYKDNCPPTAPGLEYGTNRPINDKVLCTYLKN